MRFVKLAVEAFQGVGRAEIEFGPGLNVLYGVNDLGKSTLAAAVRAALLVVPTSSEAASYVSWYADVPPRVKLTFCDDDNRFWEVSKVFAQGPSAELRHSKDGVQFTLDCKAREVEEKLRGLLRWGIASPGGKGAPRGLPVSFLANVLLASQTDVDGILKQSLENDADSSGKLRLQHALATLAQDPLFKRVLDAAQRECDLYFTETGRRRRTQGSKRMAADEEVKRFQRELEALQGQLEESRSIEDHLRACRSTREECLGQMSEAQTALTLAQSGLANANKRAAVEQQLDAARRQLGGIDAEVAALQDLRRDIDSLTQDLAERDALHAQAQADVEVSEAQLRSAEGEAHRVLQDHGQQGRQLRRAELEGELATLRERRTQLESRRELVRRASEALRGVSDANEVLAKAQASRQHTANELTLARDLSQQAAGEVEFSRALLAFTRWTLMAAQLTAAEELTRSASGQRTLAETKESEAIAIQERGERELQAATLRKGTLPTAHQLERVERARHALDIAEAALGGGLSLLVRARKPLALTTELDQQPAGQVEFDGERVFEAARSARLSVDDLIDIEISAGGAEQRRAADIARTRWRDECVPVLARAGTTSVSQLKEAVTAATQAEKVANEVLAGAEKLRSEAQALRARAELIDQQAGRMKPEAGALSARRSAVGTLSLTVLEERWVKLGKPDEARAEKEHERLVELGKKAIDHVNTLETASVLAEREVKAAEHRGQELSQVAASAQVAIDNAKPEELSRAIELELEQLSDRTTTAQAAIAALDTEYDEHRKRAQHGVEAARASLEAKQGIRVAAQQKADASREALNTKRGELIAREQQVARLDRASVAGQLGFFETALGALPEAPIATDADVQAAAAEVARVERELSEAAQEFFKAEGALTKVGGAQLREQLQQAEEGLKAAQAREREIETDALAWQLLREKLKLAEDSEAAHLGRALGEPVGRRFAELTSHRYANLEFDPLLSAASLQAAGVSVEGDVLEALSVGTRDQLATLVRLTIANQLKSSIILDDHLVQTDPVRLAWFRDTLVRTAVETQVVIFTCRPADYLRPDELPDGAVSSDFAGGMIRAVNLNSVVQRWEGARSIRR